MGEIQLLGKTVTVRQLTVKEVNEYLESKSEPPTGADLLMNREIPEKAVRLSTGLSSEELNGEVLPSDLAKLWDKVEEMNPFLADLLRRLQAAGTKMLQDMEGASKDSTDQA